MRVDAPGEVVLRTWPTDPPPNSYDAPNPGTIRTGFELTLPARTKTSITVSLIPEKAAAAANKKIGPLSSWKQDNSLK
jgi:hypothetical protein